MLYVKFVAYFCLMRKVHYLLVFLLFVSCGRHAGTGSSERIITTSIAPFSYFVTAIAGNDFNVNIMVPPGSDPHIYEPFPEQVNKLRQSEGYISNGYLGFEMTWLDRFYETNRNMKKLSLGDAIDPIESEHSHEGEHVEGADPHYWVSPVCALQIAAAVRDFVKELNPAHSSLYDSNYVMLTARIHTLDDKASRLFSETKRKSFMIYHPNLAYLARDYDLHEIAVEFEGKEPSPSKMKDLIDLAKKENIRSIFVQREYDKRNARAIAQEIGAELVVIDPLSADWYVSTTEIIDALGQSLN